MPCKRLQPSYRPSANSLTLVPSGTTEYIAAGDSQATFPFPTEIGRDFDLQWKTASGLSYMLLQLAVTAGKRAFRRRALRRPHPARREVTCGDTDMDWPRLGAVLHMTGLWGRSYLGRSREEDHQQNLTEALSKRRHGFMYIKSSQVKLSFIVIPLHVWTYSGTRCRASQDHGAT